MPCTRPRRPPRSLTTWPVKSSGTSTSTFIIGSKMIPGSISYDKFKAYVDTALMEAKAAAPAGPVDSADTK